MQVQVVKLEWRRPLIRRQAWRIGKARSRFWWIQAGPKMEAMLRPHHRKYNLLPKSSSKFMSCSSLPKSATSSSRAHRDSLTSAKHKKNKSSSKKDHQPPTLARQHSVALSNLERLRESHMRRSKSCGEGRACQPSVDFDMWFTTTTTTTNNIDRKREINNDSGHEVIMRAIANKEDEGAKTVMFHRKGGDDKFKCGACLFLPGFGKAVKARKDHQDEEAREPEPERGMTDMMMMMMMTTMDVVSKRASLEKFECRSWRSSAVINYGEEEDEEDNGNGSAGSNLFFDLPVELIRCTSINDTESPVTTAFVYDNKQQDHHWKGVLKNTTTTTTVASIGQPGRKSQESCNSSSSRHVCFSTLSPASPTCITPRLRKARDDFNAFLEAQSA